MLKADNVARTGATPSEAFALDQLDAEASDWIC